MTPAYFQDAKRQAQSRILPCLRGIYGKVERGSVVKAQQIGTGILILHRGRPAILTAKHCLYGHNGNENAGDKLIMTQSRLTEIGSLASPTVISGKTDDLAAFYVDEADLGDCLDAACLQGPDTAPPRITIAGFLARGFKVNAQVGGLLPDPRIFTSKTRDAGADLIGILYARKRFRNTDTGTRERQPIPSGLSGGPMLDTDLLVAGQVSIVGVFTDFAPERSLGYGEVSAKAVSLLSQL